MASAEPMPGVRGEAEEIGRWAGARLGVGVLAVEPVPAGIGLRRFYRLRLVGAPGSAIARVDAPEDPAGRPAGAAPEPALEPVRALLERSGLPVPRRYASDLARGIELLEDGGSETLSDYVRSAPPSEGEAQVERSLDLVPRLQRLADDGSGVAAFQRRLDASLFRYKAELFASISLPGALARPPTLAELGAVTEAFAFIARVCAEAKERFAHRDFQSQNLLLRRAVDGSAQLMLIDLQGAFLAPPEYDLVCLLRDSYLDLSRAFVLRQLERIRPALPDAPSANEFALRFDLLTLTRKGKDHARFVAASARGDARYRPYLGRTARMLRETALRVRGVAPPLARLAELVCGLPEESPCGR